MNTHKRKPLSEINVVPYIDVMLVLLVIFIITAPLLTQGVAVQLPQAAAKALPRKDLQPIIVSIDKGGNYYLNLAEEPTKPMEPKKLMVRIAAVLELAKQKNQVRDVYIKGDREVDYGKVVQAMVLLQKSGVNNVGLMTEDVLQP